MKTLDLVQGSPAWHAHRAAHDNASEASAMMGASPNLRRGDLLRLRATGGEKDFSRYTEEVIFTRGHEVEAAARPIVEAQFGIELFPATGESDEHPRLSASFDGVSMDESLTWECKQWSETKAVHVRAGRVPPEDYWQCIQQLVVARSKRHIYTLSDGTPERTIHCELTLNPEDEQHLLAGWKQFDEDLKAYVPEVATVQAVGRAPESLPALLIQVTGAVTQSNLPEFKSRAIAVFKAINTDLQTDADFADAEKTVKFCKDVEERLAAAKQHALAQTASIDELFRAVDEISAEARAKRLELDKLVTVRKATVRAEIITAGENAFREYCALINKRWTNACLPQVPTNFPGVVRGLKTVASVKDAVSTELARAKIEANEVGEKIGANLRTLHEQAGDYLTLFPDVQALVMKNEDDLVATIKSRIADHHAEQQRRAAVAPAAAPAVAPAPAAAKPRMRFDGPTVDQVVDLVANHYGVQPGVARGWLQRLNFSAAQAA